MPVAPAMSLKVEEPGSARCHWMTSGAGVPVAATEKRTLVFSEPVRLAGLLVTLSVAASGLA